MNDQHAGSCLCGTVRFTLQGQFEGFFLCHCQHCKKGTGTAHAANLFAAQASLTFTQGADVVQSFTLPETRHSRSFCKHCGSPLPTQQNEGVVVPAGCLDTPLIKQPDAHIFCARKADWEDALEMAPQFDYLPK